MLDAIAARRSIRKFKNTPVPRHIIEEIIKAGALAPPSKNRQPWKICRWRQLKTVWAACGFAIFILLTANCVHGLTAAVNLQQLLHWATLMKNLPRVRANRGVRRWSGASKLFKIKGLFYELY